jgi:hypothetical protein
MTLSPEGCVITMRDNRLTRLVAIAFAVALVATVVAVPATPASATSAVSATAGATSLPFCGIRWGSLPKSAGAAEADWLMEGRVGRHRCYDRLVFELAGPAAGVDARYVRRVSLSPGLRQPKGGARLQVRIPSSLPPASATDGMVRSSLGPVGRAPLFDVRGFRTFRDVTWGRIDARGATFGLGVRARLPFRVFLLDGPGHRSRVVVDVAHRW